MHVVLNHLHINQLAYLHENMESTTFFMATYYFDVVIPIYLTSPLLMHVWIISK